MAQNLPETPPGRSRAAEEAYYDRRWRHRQGLNVPGILRRRRVLRYVRRYAPTAANGQPRIVELGCGRGRLATRLSRLGTVMAVDLSRATLEANQRRHPEVDFRWGDVTDPALATELGSFDTAVSSEVAEHIALDARPAFFTNLARLVKPGGLLVLTTPDRGALERAGRPLRDDQPVNNLFDRQELLEWLRGDFELLEHSAVHPLVRRRPLDLAWKLLFLPLGYRGVDDLAASVGVPGTYQVLALRRRHVGA